MYPIRQIIDDAPDSIPVPSELRHQRVEIIFWPLEKLPLDEKKADTEGWPPGLFEATAGGWEGEPMVREPQGDHEKRLELE